MAIVKDLGMVTAYAYAVAGGYEGTEAEFTELLGQAGVTLEQLESLTAVAVTLAPGSEATASYSDGVLTFGIPRGNTGATGPQGPQGAQGETGNGIASITKTGTSGLVDTYTITFTDGTTTTFTVTNGADGDITNVAQAFDATKAYSVGDMVLYQGTLYAFTVAHPTGAWIGTDAQAIILSDVVADLKSDLNDVSTDLVNLSGGKQTISGVFSYGVFNSSSMPEADPRKFNAVMMTAETYNRDITLTAKDGYNFLSYFYDANGDYVSKSARWESSKYVPKNTYFRLWVRPDPLDTSIVLNLDTVKQQILFNVPIQDEIDDTVKSVALANANAELSGAGLQMIDTSFAYGTMNTQTGQAVSNTAYKYQVIMPTYATYDRDVTIKCNSGYRYQVWWYNADDTYISRTASFRTDADEYTVTAGTHFRLFVTLNPQNTSANVPVETFAENIFIRTKINDRVTAVETKPLSTLPEYILNTLSYRQVGVLSKGYILLSCDDGTAGLATYTIPMLINKNVPATFGLLMTSPVITDESYLETVIDAVENHRCCVAQHGSTQWTTYAEDALNKYFDDTEALFTEKGITEIHGAICPGGAVADTNALVQAVAGGRFKSLFSGGLQGEIKYGNYNAVGARTNMYAMARYSAIGFTQQTYQQAIDDAYDNHYILCPFWHDYSVVDDTSKQAIIEGMIDYAKTKGLTFITTADLPTII